CSRHLSRSQAEIPLIPAVQISRASSDNIDKNDVIESVTAGWKRGAVDYSFVQIGSSAVINMSSSR
ncbi:hypothetical protein ABVB70_26530, partial [Agrobacterium radiobacter]